MSFLKLLKGQLRFYSNNAFKNTLEHLNTRSLIRVSGAEAGDFLQGLVTNDIQHLEKPSTRSIYSMFLNTKGRVLYDSIIYKISKDTYFVECDLTVLQSLKKHMMFYRVRRKIDISSLENEYKVFVLFKNIAQENSIPTNNQYDNLNISIQDNNKLIIFKDPRVNELGYRILSQNDVNVQNELNFNNLEYSDSCTAYKELRYYLGIGEGVNDIPVETSFPLEANCDYLHGVSFHKGCYIGQELTARTHHTGVVRKRLMPIYFKNSPSIPLKTDKIDIDQSNLGKLRGIAGNFGLALLRIEKALELKEFKVGNETARVFKPHWWPVTLPKEKITQLGKDGN